MRIDLPAPPCPTCRRGCECDGSTGAPDCGHHGCWGRAQTPSTPDCPGVAYERQRAAVLAARVTNARRSQDHYAAAWRETHRTVTTRHAVRLLSA